MVHCKACELVGSESIHSLSYINTYKKYGNTDGECTLGFAVFRNSMRTSEEIEYYHKYEKCNDKEQFVKLNFNMFASAEISFYQKVIPPLYSNLKYSLD